MNTFNFLLIASKKTFWCGMRNTKGRKATEIALLLLLLFASGCTDSVSVQKSFETGGELAEVDRSNSQPASQSNTIVQVDSLTICPSVKGILKALHPISIDFAPNRIPAAAEDFLLPTWLSILAYKKKEAIFANLTKAGFLSSQLHYFDTFRPAQGSFLSSQGFVAQSAHARYVVFRGSDSPFDWISNFKMNLIPGQKYFPGKVQVHSGFMELVESGADEIFRVLASVDPETAKLPVWFIGHSLGGAQAAMIALLAANQGINVGAVVTLGQPRAGNTEFANQLDSTLGFRYVRLVNPEDVVPHVPPTADAAVEASRFLARFPVPRSEDELLQSFKTWEYAHAGKQFNLVSDGTVDAATGKRDFGESEFFQSLIKEAGLQSQKTNSTSVELNKGKALITRAFKHMPEGIMCALLNRKQ